MTREEAIAYGKRVIGLGLNDETQAFCELAIKALDQDQKTGHWRDDIDNNRTWDRGRFYCSECGDWQTYGKPHYCPNCGAKMVEP